MFILSVLIFSISNTSTQVYAAEDYNKTIQLKDLPPVADTIIPIDVIFAGYNEDYIDLSYLNAELDTTLYYEGIDAVYNESTDDYVSLLDLVITLDFNFHFVSESYEQALDTFIETNSWEGTTSGLNITKLNLQEETGERQSIFYEQEGRAIDGEAVEEYLAENKGYVSDEPSYAIYFLNQSKYDTTNHSLEHWFEIDEIDPDSNVTADWWRLEWDNALNPDVEFPYPCWGFRNRLFFVDPYSYQWYTKWTDIWWNPDNIEGERTHLTEDLDTYLSGYTPDTPDFSTRLNQYLKDYLNDITSDVAGRGDGYIRNEKEISSQILFINDEANHGYSQEDLKWIYNKEEIEESFEYVMPPEVGNITLEETWVELSESPEIAQIISDNIMGASELGSYSWYRSDWTYLNGIGIFDSFIDISDNYFDLEKGDKTFTEWILLLQNVSMIGYSYGEYREYTGLGGSGNVVCYKDLNRYFESDGVTPRSGVSTLLIHEIGHVLGFQHAEIRNDAEEGTGGFMRDVMSYYTIGCPDFSIFLKDSLYRTSSFVAYYRTIDAINTYRININSDPWINKQIEDLWDAGESALESMDYVTAFLSYRQLYDIVENQLEITTKGFSLFYGLPVIILIPIGLLVFKRRKHQRKS